MSIIYNDNIKYKHECSEEYEDTELGRIYSKQYEHLNYKCNNEPINKYYRHHGN